MNELRSLGLASLMVVSAALVAGACGGDDDATTSSGGSGGSGGGTGGVGGGTGGMGGTTSSSSSSSGSGGMPPTGPIGTCAEPIDIMPGEVITSNTAGAMDNLQGPCQMGSDGDSVYSFTADATGTIAFTLTSDADLGLYARTSCEDDTTGEGCTDLEFGPGAVETLTLDVLSGTTYFIVVDGFEAGEAGPFTLEVAGAIEVETCNNMVDDNNNAFVDCEDVGCYADATCVAAYAAACMAATPLTTNTTINGDTTNGSNTFAGLCTGVGSPEDVYSYTPANDEIVSVVLSSATDQGVYIRTDCADGNSQLGCQDTQLGGTDEILRHRFLTAAQPYSLFVDGYMAGEEGPYSVMAMTAQPNEMEPNDAFGMANAFSNGYLGYIQTGDNDWISVTVAANGSITATTADVFANDCTTSQIDTEIELFDTDGATSLQFNDDIDEMNGDYCSTVTATGLAAGTYFIRVSASAGFCPTCFMGYTLQVTL